MLRIEHHVAEQALQPPPLLRDWGVEELLRQQAQVPQEVHDRLNRGAPASFRLPGQSREQHADQTRAGFEALGVPPEPEEVVGNP